MNYRKKACESHAFCGSDNPFSKLNISENVDMFTTEISRSEMQHSVNLVDLDQRFGSDIRYIRLGRSREQAVSSSASSVGGAFPQAGWYLLEQT